MNKQLRLPFFLLITILFASVASAETAISTCEELHALYVAAINGTLDNSYYLTGDIDCSATATWGSWLGGCGSYVCEGFHPIGGGAVSGFNKTFDGRGFTISNLYSRSDHPNTQMGLFAIMNGTVMDVHLRNATIIGTNPPTGGLVGILNGTLSDSSFEGDVTAGWSTGGLVGRNSGTITRSYSAGTVTGTELVGGLAGDGTGTITQSYSTSDVVGTGEQVGGFIGFLNGSSGGTALIENSYAKGDVTGGTNKKGGFVGWNYSGTINHSYSVGSVELTGSNVGGFGGASSVGSSYEYNYWDEETSGITTGSSSGSPKTTVEMQTKDTFVDWDFETIWALDEGVDYPCLRWQPDCVFNLRPTADAGGPYDIVSSGGSETITLDGSGSYDPEGDPLTYQWVIGSTVNTANCSADPAELTKVDPIVTCLNEGTADAELTVRDATKPSLPDTGTINFTIFEASFSLVLDPILIKEREDFTEAKAIVSNPGTAASNVDVVVQLISSITHQEVADREEEVIQANLLLPAGASVDVSLLDWIDADGTTKPALPMGNYSLHVEIRVPGTFDVLDQVDQTFTVGTGRTVPVPELDLLLLPLLLSIVLLVLWRKC